ncbi:PspC domain-containing protein [Fictibacillus aquaticus]|uniref:PspC domain-containing protein n=1 Tax=Fictibacillus aquaticus TaxID=2021314 RepID=UPI0035F0F745
MKKIVRTENQFLAGVCSGLARYFEVDATLVRLGLVLLAVLTAFLPVAAAYVIAMIVIPLEGEE